jgi:hypothetical protein
MYLLFECLGFQAGKKNLRFFLQIPDQQKVN